jgi:hypothetical protein
VNPLRQALADGAPRVAVEAGLHEVGHAVAWRHAGFRVDHLQVRVGWLGGVDAYCRLTSTPRLTDRNAEPYLVGLMAGVASARRFNSRHTARHDSAELRHLRGWTTLSEAQLVSRARKVLAGYGWGRIERLAAELTQKGQLPGGAV